MRIMTAERTVWVEGKPQIVVLSDEREALLAAQAAGRAVVAVEKGEADGRGSGAEKAKSGVETGNTEFLPARYVVASPEMADDRYLERVVRRHLGLPWTIAETERLLIREFTESDAAFVLREDTDSEADRVFYSPDLLREYIRCQYGFYECGVWALIEKTGGTFVGKAGLTPATGETAGSASTAGETANLMPAAGEATGSASMAGETAGLTPAADETAGPASSEIEPVRLELGYHIFQPYRRQGYATEACRAILKMLRDEAVKDGDFGSRIIVTARTAAANLGSIRVLERCGFARNGDISASDGDGQLLYCRAVSETGI